MLSEFVRIRSTSVSISRIYFRQKLAEGKIERVREEGTASQCEDFRLPEFENISELWFARVRGWKLDDAFDCWACWERCVATRLGKIPLDNEAANHQGGGNEIGMQNETRGSLRHIHEEEYNREKSWWNVAIGDKTRNDLGRLTHRKRAREGGVSREGEKKWKKTSRLFSEKWEKSDKFPKTIKAEKIKNLEAKKTSEINKNKILSQHYERKKNLSECRVEKQISEFVAAR